ncbi:MAG: glutathione S-transferase family protein [Acetobacteraceae bacterium]|nr:glutathione S-transferase family protein [Acetobacteraceae bacterium]
MTDAPYILYGDEGSGSGPVEMALAEIGAPVELRRVPLEGDHQLAAEYRRINPMGRIPTLVLPDGTVVTELIAILLTLDDRHRAAGLLPAPGEPARAVALRWTALLCGEFYPHVTRWDYPDRFLPGADPAQVQALRDRAQAMGRDILRLIETQALTGPGPYLLADRFSLADLVIATLSRWIGGRQWTPTNCPRIEALAQAVAARPATAAIWRRHRLESAA